MAVEQFVSKTLELLQEEREAEIEETRYVKPRIVAHVNRIMRIRQIFYNVMQDTLVVFNIAKKMCFRRTYNYNECFHAFY